VSPVIIAVEGPSAVGKTTWSRLYFPHALVECASEKLHAPDLYDEPAAVARFWVDFNAGLWQRAVQTEKREGLAVCDTDPLHLYFSWALWKVGAIAKDLFDAEVLLYRRAIAGKRIGFADVVLWREAPVNELRKRAKLDATRSRRRHKLYLSLVPWMRTWFDARAHALPQTVLPWPEHARAEDFRNSKAETPKRYSVETFDAMLLDLGAAAN
jgi:hypothetical protein